MNKPGTVEPAQEHDRNTRPQMWNYNTLVPTPISHDNYTIFSHSVHFQRGGTVASAAPAALQAAVPVRLKAAAPGHHSRCEEVRHQSPPRDALPAPDGAEGRRRGALLRQGRELRQGTGVVQDADAALLSRTDHDREEPQLLRHPGGGCNGVQFQVNPK